MLIPIPMGQQYRSEVQIQLERSCRCEKCNNMFRYRYKLSGVGTGDSPLWLRNEGAREGAQSQAQAALEKQLATAFPLYPCPACGHFQSGMVAYFRAHFARGLFGFALFMLAAFGIVSLLFILIDGPRNTIATPLFWKINIWPLLLLGLHYSLKRLVRPRQSPNAYKAGNEPIADPEVESIAIVPGPQDPPALQRDDSDFYASRNYGRIALFTTILFPVSIVFSILSIREYKNAVKNFREFPDYSPIPDRSGLTYAIISLSIIGFFMGTAILASIF